MLWNFYFPCLFISPPYQTSVWLFSMYPEPRWGLYPQWRNRLHTTLYLALPTDHISQCWVYWGLHTSSSMDRTTASTTMLKMVGDIWWYLLFMLHFNWSYYSVFRWFASLFNFLNYHSKKSCRCIIFIQKIDVCYQQTIIIKVVPMIYFSIVSLF